ncbi:MAG TPA: cytochrome c3 family protein [Anaerolineales bacterium]|nr:cytochrome c3 family protein [Anaerolineales bacterium]
MKASNGRRGFALLWPGLSLVLVVLVVGAALLSRRVALAAPAQPIAFPHRLHANAGVPCLFCHPNAMRSPIAGLPSVQRCMGCHAYVERGNPEVKKIAQYWEEEKPIPWARVILEPDFVYFSHQPHLSAGLNCETCHGDVASMGTYQPVARMDMGWCLDCHLEQPQEDAARLTDCLTCHR